MSEKLCTNCIYEKVLAGLAPCINCSPITKNHFVGKHRTNADRIRSMSDEELAEFITPRKCVDCHIPDCGVGEIADNKSCVERMLDWLRKEETK